ncbi:precorrin-2 dehydrogenase/sirohydrochlorin ferrochelatase family protein [Shewanella sp.]|uniref:precorrin-2 dehydrogenase/sirohydrochlorin ferrochelatase family protein n=1 Tax=Shewanella sp. TaxID=50422 RepID=UPI003A97603A
MQYFPIYLDTHTLKVLVIGAGEVACRKLDLLSRTQAMIEVIAPEVCAEVQHYAAIGRITLTQREVTLDDLSERDLIYIATANHTLNLSLAAKAKELGAWVNVVDTPAACDFITPSIIDRDRLVVAISTAGAAPIYARDLRGKLEAMLPNSLAPLFDFIAQKREEVQQLLPSGAERRRFWERFFNTNGERFDSNTPQRYQQCFTEATSQGELLLIDVATPAQLLPLAALPLLQRIDRVIALAEVTPELQELLRRDAERAAPMSDSELVSAWQHGQRILLVVEDGELARLKAAFPFAKHLRPGAI